MKKIDLAWRMRTCTAKIQRKYEWYIRCLLYGLVTPAALRRSLDLATTLVACQTTSFGYEPPVPTRNSEVNPLFILYQKVRKKKFYQFRPNYYRTCRRSSPPRPAAHSAAAPRRGRRRRRRSGGSRRRFRPVHRPSSQVDLSFEKHGK